MPEFSFGAKADIALFGFYFLNLLMELQNVTIACSTG